MILFYLPGLVISITGYLVATGTLAFGPSDQRVLALLLAVGFAAAGLAFFLVMLRDLHRYTRRRQGPPPASPSGRRARLHLPGTSPRAPRVRCMVQ